MFYKNISKMKKSAKQKVELLENIVGGSIFIGFSYWFISSAKK